MRLIVLKPRHLLSPSTFITGCFKLFTKCAYVILSFEINVFFHVENKGLCGKVFKIKIMFLKEDTNLTTFVTAPLCSKVWFK